MDGSGSVGPPRVRDVGERDGFPQRRPVLGAISVRVRARAAGRYSSWLVDKRDEIVRHGRMEEPIVEEDLPVEMERAAAVAMDGGTSDRVLPGGRAEECVLRTGQEPWWRRKWLRGVGRSRDSVGKRCFAFGWRSRCGEQKYNFEFRIAALGLAWAAARLLSA